MTRAERRAAQSGWLMDPAVPRRHLQKARAVRSMLRAVHRPVAAEFEACQGRKVVLRGAQLKLANFSKADLTGALAHSGGTAVPTQ